MRRLGYLTSHLYPFGFGDKSSVSASLVGGVLEQPPTLFKESVGAGAALTGGWLRDFLQEYSMSTDIATTSALFVGGTMRSALLSSTCADTASAFSVLVSGVMEKKLITYTPGRDVASTAASLVSGVLQ